MADVEEALTSLHSSNAPIGQNDYIPKIVRIILLYPTSS